MRKKRSGRSWKRRGSSIRTNEEQTRRILSRLHAREEEKRKKKRTVLRLTALGAAFCIVCGGVWTAYRLSTGLFSAKSRDMEAGFPQDAVNGMTGAEGRPDESDPLPDDGNKGETGDPDGELWDGPYDGDAPSEGDVSGKAFLRAFLGDEYPAALKAPLFRAVLRVWEIRRTEGGTRIFLSLREKSLLPPDGSAPETYLRDLLQTSHLSAAVFSGGTPDASPAHLTAEADPTVTRENGELFFDILIKDVRLKENKAQFIALRFASGDILRDCALVFYNPASEAR